MNATELATKWAPASRHYLRTPTGLSDAKYSRKREKLCVNEGEVPSLKCSVKGYDNSTGEKRGKKGILLKSCIFVMVLKSKRSFSHDMSV